jgi:GxxExxY protein
MPILSSVKVRPLGPDEFERVDYGVMGCAYACQNKLGRLCDEDAYKVDLKARLLAEGFRSVETEIPVTVTYRDFSKRYFLDLIVDDALYELKAHTALIPEDGTQLLNYMFLLGVQRGKLLNFRAPKIQGKLIATSLTQADRRRFSVSAEDWRVLDSACEKLQEGMLELLRDWGAFLETGLYQDGLIYLAGGPGKVEQRVKLHRDKVDLGSQRMLLHGPGVAFRLTAFSQNPDSVKIHLSRLLALTELEAIQWINLNHSTVEFKTINRMAGK